MLLLLVLPLLLLLLVLQLVVVQPTLAQLEVLLLMLPASMVHRAEL